jgi:hypothetical protein
MEIGGTSNVSPYFMRAQFGAIPRSPQPVPHSVRDGSRYRMTETLSGIGRLRLTPFGEARTRQVCVPAQKSSWRRTI